jgi:hypothetical protein
MPIELLVSSVKPLSSVQRSEAKSPNPFRTADYLIGSYRAHNPKVAKNRARCVSRPEVKTIFAAIKMISGVPPLSNRVPGRGVCVALTLRLAFKRARSLADVHRGEFGLKSRATAWTGDWAHQL